MTLARSIFFQNITNNFLNLFGILVAYLSYGRFDEFYGQRDLLRKGAQDRKFKKEVTEHFIRTLFY